MKKKVIIIPIFIILAFIIAFGAGTYFTINSKLSKLKTTNISKNATDLGIDTKQFNNTVEDNYVNILLLGVDTRDANTDTGRSDSIMILTLDKAHKKIKLTSLMRDLLVTNVGSKSQDKLTHAYAYGGPQLSLKVVNENFNMNIKDYVKVDFTHFDKIVDAVGGVDINVSDAEVKVLNGYITELAKLEKVTPQYLTSGGMQHLNGMQALAYARIRYVGDGDYQRTERQRTVLTQVFSKISSMGLTEASSMLDTILPNVETSLAKSDILSNTSYVLMNKINTVNQYRVPNDKPGYATNRMINGVFYLDWNKEGNIADLHQFIFEGDLK